MQFLFSAFQILELHVVRKLRFYGALLILLILLGIPALIYLVPASEFPRGILIEVAEDETASETISRLKEAGIIESELAFKVLARLSKADRGFQAGRYQFVHPVGSLEVLRRLTNGISGIPVIRITFPEGMTSFEMAERLEEEIPAFDGAAFERLARPEEGYLFPDTYDFYGDTTPEEAVELLRNTFAMKIAQIQEEIEAFGKPLEDVVIMASLLEREGKTLEDRRMIAGILWARLEADIALQVDAVFGYIHKRDTYHPSLADLEIDSPYNTYKYPGLPPGAIANPGLESLLAAVTPIESEYLYYLTGEDGKMYYAETFEEHKRNRELYLH